MYVRPYHGTGFHSVARAPFQGAGRGPTAPSETRAFPPGSGEAGGRRPGEAGHSPASSQRGPAGVSSTASPARLSSSRMASAVA